MCSTLPLSWLDYYEMLIFISVLQTRSVSLPDHLSHYQYLSQRPIFVFLFMQIIQTQSRPSGSGHVIQGPQKDDHKETRGPGTRDDLVAELITQPSSQDSAINYDINFSVAIVSLHDSRVSPHPSQSTGRTSTHNLSFFICISPPLPLCPPVSYHLGSQGARQREIFRSALCLFLIQRLTQTDIPCKTNSNKMQQINAF